jgi:N-glycosidase YbiA
MRFRGPYAFLSHVAPCPVRLEGVVFATVEHAYQAAKALSPERREAIQRCPTPAAAKRLGRTLEVRPDWEAITLDVMRQLLRQKFRREPWRTWLLAVSGPIVEDHDSGDTFWGVCRGRGENHLGRLLMQIREEWRQGTGG